MVYTSECCWHTLAQRTSHWQRRADELGYCWRARTHVALSQKQVDQPNWHWPSVSQVFASSRSRSLSLFLVCGSGRCPYVGSARSRAALSSRPPFPAPFNSSRSQTCAVSSIRNIIRSKILFLSLSDFFAFRHCPRVNWAAVFAWLLGNPFRQKRRNAERSGDPAERKRNGLGVNREEKKPAIKFNEKEKENAIGRKHVFQISKLLVCFFVCVCRRQFRHLFLAFIFSISYAYRSVFCAGRLAELG